VVAGPDYPEQAMNPIILSPGAVSCGCLLARALLTAAQDRGALVVMPDRPKLPDIDTHLFDLALRYEREEITIPLDLKKTAYERP
jgi:hypothetical protein